jgi:LacI family transcriptional regulator
MHVGIEQTRRAVDGVLRYVDLHPDLSVRDFNYPKNDRNLPDQPPWRGSVDGVVTNLARFPHLVPWLCSGGVPVVNTTADMTNELVSAYTDAKSIARLAVEHFTSLSRRSIAYVGYRHADGSRDRRLALEEELNIEGLPLAAYETDKFFTGTYDDFVSIGELEAELLDVLRETAKPMAVLALNDRWAVNVCRIARELGFSVPEDVAVLGVEDWDTSRLASPPISSIRTNGEQIGYEAAHLLHRMIRGERLPQRNVAVPAIEVVARESTVGRLRAAATDIKQALAYIHETACEGIRNEDVANHVHVPLRTLELQFAASVGRTVGAEIRHVRLARAKHLLETTDMSMARVAHLIGLSSASTLTTFLRRWADITPKAYRRAHRETSSGQSSVVAHG